MRNSWHDSNHVSIYLKISFSFNKIDIFVPSSILQFFLYIFTKLFLPGSKAACLISATRPLFTIFAIRSAVGKNSFSAFVIFLSFCSPISTHAACHDIESVTQLQLSSKVIELFFHACQADCTLLFVSLPTAVVLGASGLCFF
jgi:hypothetical protein